MGEFPPGGSIAARPDLAMVASGAVRTWGHTLAKVAHLGERLFSCGGSGHFDRFSSLFFMKFCFGTKSGPRGSLGTKKSAIDAENAKESENRTQNP